MKEFNCARNSRKIYSTKKDYFEKKLKMTKEKSLFIDISDIYDGRTIPINNYNSFDELNKIFDEETSSSKIPDLEIRENLVIPLPKDTSVLKNIDYMANQFVTKKIGLSGVYNYFGFHSEIGLRNAELSCFLQLLDDNNLNRSRRKNILNSKFKYVGISIGRLDDNEFAIYCLFAG